MVAVGFSYTSRADGLMLSIWSEVSAFPWAINSNLGKLCLYLYFQDRSFGLTVWLQEDFCSGNTTDTGSKGFRLFTGQIFRLHLKNGCLVGYMSFFEDPFAAEGFVLVSLFRISLVSLVLCNVSWMDNVLLVFLLCFEYLSENLGNYI